jgi:anaerobic magnesium-protoporphyrin IX monomethyl ester cyclase
VRELKVLFTAGPGVSLPAAGKVQVEENVPATAIYALGAVVEKAGFECTIVDPIRYWRDLKTDDDLQSLAEGHDVICVSANVATWPLAIPLIKVFARCRPRPFIIVGGLHPSYCSDHVVSTTETDVVVRGEGERTLPLVLHALAAGEALDSIPGLTLRSGDGPVRTPDAAPLSTEELNAAPLPLWERLPSKVYAFLPIEASRGCLFACLFCGIQHKHLWRPIAIENVAARVRQGVRSLHLVKLRSLMFADDCFTTDPERVRQIAEVLERDAPGIPIAIEARASDVVKPEVLDGLKRMCIEFLQVGVECGYAEGLRRIRKGISIDQVVASVDALHSAGVEAAAKYSYIVGFPWETREHMARTISFALSLASRHANRCQVAWLMVAPGSEIYDAMAREGRVGPADFDVPSIGHWDLFVRTHPTVDAEIADSVREYAALLLQNYPWVGSLGGVFDPLSRFFRLPADSRPDARECGAGGYGDRWSSKVFWEQMPPLLRYDLAERRN